MCRLDDDDIQDDWINKLTKSRLCKCDGNLMAAQRIRAPLFVVFG